MVANEGVTLVMLSHVIPQRVISFLQDFIVVHKGMTLGLKWKNITPKVRRERISYLGSIEVS